MVAGLCYRRQTYTTSTCIYATAISSTCSVFLFIRSGMVAGLCYRREADTTSTCIYTTSISSNSSVFLFIRVAWWQVYATVVKQTPHPHVYVLQQLVVLVVSASI